MSPVEWAAAHCTARLMLASGASLADPSHLPQESPLLDLCLLKLSASKRVKRHLLHEAVLVLPKSKDPSPAELEKLFVSFPSNALSIFSYALKPLIQFSDFGNYSNYSNELPEPDEYLCPEVRGWADQLGLKAVFVLLAYSAIFLLGMMGNTLVLVILKSHRTSRSSTETFLLHLAVADLLLVLTLPFAMIEGAVGWVLGAFFCKAVSALHKVNFYCSSLLLACIAVDRYLAIVHAVHTYRHRRLLSVRVTCAAVWLASFLCALPELLFVKVSKSGANNSATCSFSGQGLAGSNAWLTSRFLYHVGGFLIPLLVMGWCYAGVVKRLCQAQRRHQRQKAIKVAILVTGVFFFCWSPYHVVIFLDTLVMLDAVPKSCQLDDHLATAITTCEFLGLAHCCLNPVLYTFVGVKFRSDLIRLLGKLGCMVPAARHRFLSSWRKGSSSESENATSITTF
ncbi:C-X-C chemokine receptor type 5 [Gracilinanus agilis]|uniref:C-X-C chemokine receptor type 5 n=1 Tax=Gracilinanus agilis TaxID=191870 RepID=UPI001CFDF40F|nr:C-X-C chemokine receptor type 5 [Gracilinanus agilis]